jgi:hypothetical protein
VLIFPAILITIYIIISKANIDFPLYLKLLVIFTLYHLFSAIYFQTIPTNINISLNSLPIPAYANILIYTLSDYSVLSCFLVFIVQNTYIDKAAINYFNRNIVYVIILSFIVSLIQLKYKGFFISTTFEESIYSKMESRIPSIFSWYNFNSLGISFPILISLALSTIRKQQKIRLGITLLSLLTVSFLSKARYVMISGIIVFSQLLFSKQYNIKRKVQFITISIFIVIIGITIADKLDYNIQNVVQERILEGGKYSSAMARVKSYVVFLYVFPQNPWFGVGPSFGNDVKRLLGKGILGIHVGYLSYLYYYGIFGSFLLFICIILLLRKAYFVGRNAEFWGVFYGLIAFCFANATMVYFNLSEPGIILSIIYLQYYENQLRMNQENIQTNHIM